MPELAQVLAVNVTSLSWDFRTREDLVVLDADLERRLATTRAAALAQAGPSRRGLVAAQPSLEVPAHSQEGQRFPLRRAHHASKVAMQVHGRKDRP
jgi:hypothetical protein